MMVQAIQVRLVQCEPAFGGFVIRWHALDKFEWGIMLSLIKALPRSDRRHVDGMWWVSRDGMEQLRPHIANWQDAIATMPHQTPTMPPDVRQAYKALYLTPGAPLVAVRAVYRVLATDVQSTDTSRLSAALVRLEAWIGAKEMIAA